MRKVNLKIYFKDSPHPWTFMDVTNFNCEGGLLRIHSDNGDRKEWYPLENIFRICEISRTEV